MNDIELYEPECRICFDRTKDCYLSCGHGFCQECSE